MKKWFAWAVAASLIASLSGLAFLVLTNAALRKQVAAQATAIAAAKVSIIAAAGGDYASVRTAVIRAQISLVKAPVIFLGDSIVESAVLPSTICGHPVINAGVSGARISFFAEWAPQFTRESDPALAILAVGINDALAAGINNAGKDETSFRTAYAATLQSIDSPVAVATIVGANTPRIAPAEIERLNKVIGQLAEGRPVIDLHEAVAGPHTIDGIHLNADDYKLWTAAILSGARRAVGCVETN